MSAPPAAQPTAPTLARPGQGSRAHRYRDCMRRYNDAKGCRYLAWHDHKHK